MALRGSTATDRVVRAVRRIDDVLRRIVAVVVALMMMLIVVDATGRLFRHPLPGVVEITSEYLMVAIVFLAVAFVQSDGRHVRIELFESWWPGLRRRAVRAIVDLLGAVYFAFLAWQVTETAAHAWSVGQRSTSVLGYPMFPAYAIVVLGCALVALWLLLDVLLPDKAARLAEPEAPHD